MGSVTERQVKMIITTQTQTTTKRERHNCGGGNNQRWQECTLCGKRIHRQGCTSRLDPKKDCNLKEDCNLPSGAQA